MRNGGLSFRPVLHEVSYHLVCDDLGRLQSWHISRVIAGNHLLQTFSRGHAWRLTIIVTDGAQHQNRSEIDALGLTQEPEGLQRARIFHGCDYVITFAGCVVASPSVGPLIHLRAVPERTCRQDIASRYQRAASEHSGNPRTVPATCPRQRSQYATTLS